MKRSELVRALWPLPGGNKHYLDTLNRILQWAASTEEPTRDGFREWLMTEYNVSDSTVSSYLSVVTRLGALETQGNGTLRITPFGEKILLAEPDDKARIVLEHLMTNYLAFPEVLAVYNKAVPRK
jgi:restriction endonuclease Mrr